MDPSPTEATTPAAPSAKTATTLWLSFREKLPVVLGGTASLLFLATVLMQLAAGENKTARAEEAGRASVAAPASKPLARVGTVTIAYD
ncbi:MAG: hypothetical protein AAGJ97_14050, partial [Planctomycetota bacterium]